MPEPDAEIETFGVVKVFERDCIWGVPIGVAIPPIFAATGMERVRAMRPFPFAGSALNTGARNVSIIAAVAVLLTNIENVPVIRMKPSKTFSLSCPNGLSRVRAKRKSRPALVAAIAITNPPRKRMMIGSANVAMMSFDFNKTPRFPPESS